MNMKGQVFLTDIIFGISLVLILFLFVPIKFESVFPDASYQKLSYEAQDVMNALSLLNVSEISTETTVQNLIQSGSIQQKDMSKSVLDLIGSFWYNGNLTIAQNITRETLGGLTDFCFNLTTSNSTVYSSCNTSSNTISVSEKIVSGYQVGQPVSGYIARAFAVKETKNNTLVVKGEIISGSVKKTNGGNNQNTVGITYDLTIPLNSTLIDSYWYIEGVWTDNKIKAFINGQFIGTATGNGRFNHLDQYLNIGYNNLTLLGTFGSNGPEAGDDGTSHFVVNYSTPQPSTIPQSNDINFAYVTSNTSIRYKKPIFVIGTVNGLAVNLSAIGSTALLSFVYNGQTYNISTKNIVNNNVYWNNTEISNALSSDGISYSNLGTTYFYFIVYVDTYHSQENLGSGRAIFNTSYVEVNYTSKTNVYGQIDITNTIPGFSFSNPDQISGFYRNVAWQFNHNSLYTPLGVDSLLSWLYYSGTTPRQNISANSVALYRSPPQPLIVELARFGYANYSGEIMNGLNNYTLNFSQGYAVGPTNSLITYTFLVPSQVGYGSVFNTSQQAAADAQQRLLNLLQPAGITANQINIDNQSISGIEWLWGPAIFNVVAWSQ